MIKNVTLEELTLANWEAKTTGEEEIPFSFDDWEPMDLIDEQVFTYSLFNSIGGNYEDREYSTRSKIKTSY